MPALRADAPYRTLLRHQAGALSATAVDFTTMIACVHLAHLTPVQGTVVGAACGAITNLTLGRRWIFQAVQCHAGGQAARYALVSLASVLLNAAGEHLLHDVPGVQYILA